MITLYGKPLKIKNENLVVGIGIDKLLSTTFLAIGCALIGLKLGGFLVSSWWLVTVPLWAPPLISLIWCLLQLMTRFLAMSDSEWTENEQPK